MPSNLQPGPALDALVCEALGIAPDFYWVVDPETGLSFGNSHGSLEDAELTIAETGVNWEIRRGYPSVSTTWSRMRLVVKAMNKRGFTFQLTTCDEGANVIFASGEDDPENWDPTKLGAPYAVCLAALKALGKESDAIGKPAVNRRNNAT